MSAGPFLLRRMAARERELGFAIRECLESHEQPPMTLREEHRAVWELLRSARRASGNNP